MSHRPCSYLVLAASGSFASFYINMRESAPSYSIFSALCQVPSPTMKGHLAITSMLRYLLVAAICSSQAFPTSICMRPCLPAPRANPTGRKLTHRKQSKFKRRNPYAGLRHHGTFHEKTVLWANGTSLLACIHSWLLQDLCSTTSCS
jgi:hypothetical protein